MGIFDFVDLLSGMNTDSYGYKAFKNVNHWNNEDMLRLLSEVKTPYDPPKMGWIRAFGKERQVVVYSKPNKTNYIYVDANPRKIVVSMAPKPGQIGGAVEHVDPADVSPKNENTIGATLSTMEPVEHIIFAVEKLLEKPDEVKRYI